MSEPQQINPSRCVIKHVYPLVINCRCGNRLQIETLPPNPEQTWTVHLGKGTFFKCACGWEFRVDDMASGIHGRGTVFDLPEAVASEPDANINRSEPDNRGDN